MSFLIGLVLGLVVGGALVYLFRPKIDADIVKFKSKL